jgi:hypothetical protein
MILQHRFVEKIPETIDEGVLYISIPFEVAIHRCCCGCGNEVVTPFSPKQWHLTFDGESVTLYPSIGNWGLECRSHYYIRKNVVIWLKTYSKQDIEKVKKSDSKDLLKFFAGKNKRDRKIGK